MSQSAGGNGTRDLCPACAEDRKHADHELKQFHPKRWDFEEATRDLKFTKDFNRALEATMRDRLATIGERVMAWCKRRSWGNYSLYCVKDNSEPAFQVDCAAELGVDKRRVSETMRYYAARGYLEIRGPAKLLYPVISPRIVGPSDPEEKSEEYRTFLDFCEVARSTVKHIREVQRSDYKQWRALRTKSGANKGGDSESSENLASSTPSPSSPPPEDLLEHMVAIARDQRASLGAPNEQTIKNFWEVAQRSVPGVGVKDISDLIMRILEKNGGLTNWGGVFKEFRKEAEEGAKERAKAGAQ